MKTLGILCALNEEEKVGKSVKDLKPYVDKVLVVDDGSTDNTTKEAKKHGATVISHKKNLGVGAAVKTSVKYVQKNNYDICLHFASDDQDAAISIPYLLSKIKEGYDLVQGSRYLEGGKKINQPIFRTITTWAYSLFFSILVGKRITDASNGFRAYKTDILKKNINIWQDWLNRYELEPYLLYKAIKAGYKVIEVPVIKKYPKDKSQGYTKMKPFIDWWRITKPLIYLKFKIKT